MAKFSILLCNLREAILRQYKVTEATRKSSKTFICGWLTMRRSEDGNLYLVLNSVFQLRAPRYLGTCKSSDETIWVIYMKRYPGPNQIMHEDFKRKLFQLLIGATFEVNIKL
ncbi:unnamed protein product [Allacma fusca]|uniref:Uncharacterized protein n=1 Tax=Allacma fusca TaxID=39272 RepID=A0A8J2PEY0_9HEXA|nr:unnamed protein product [Allacma fusca]